MRTFICFGGLSIIGGVLRERLVAIVLCLCLCIFILFFQSLNEIQESDLESFQEGYLPVEESSWREPRDFTSLRNFMLELQLCFLAFFQWFASLNFKSMLLLLGSSYWPDTLAIKNKSSADYLMKNHSLLIYKSSSVSATFFQVLKNLVKTQAEQVER